MIDKRKDIAKIKNKTKRKIGIVTSDKMKNTVVVKISRMIEHPLYRKKYSVSSKLKADNPKDEAKIGDMVQIEETRPISRDKTWKIIKIINKGEKDDTTI